LKNWLKFDRKAVVENANHPRKLTYLYQKFDFIAISGWFHPHFRHCKKIIGRWGDGEKQLTESSRQKRKSSVSSFEGKDPLLFHSYASHG